MLTTQDYDRILGVVTDCGGAADVDGFSGLLVEALARWWGYRAVTVCQGDSFGSALTEASPVTSGLGTRLVQGYHERFGQGNVLRSPQAAEAITTGRSVLTAALDRRRLDPAQHDYLGRFLAPHGVRSQLACYVGDAAGPGLLVVLSDADVGAFDAHDQVVWAKLRGPLAALARAHQPGPPSLPGLPRPGPVAALDPAPATGRALTAREREVATLARTGRTNRGIARSLGIAEDTVKQHMTQVLAKTGVRSRTQLAALPRLPGP